MKSMLALAVAAVALALPPALADTPKPSVVPVSWQLDFEFKNLQPIRVTLPGESEPRTFWYLIYMVTNRTGQDRLFVPDCVLYTDTGEVIRAGRGVPPNVFAEIKKLHNDPLLQDSTAVTGKLLQGDDNAKTGVAIFSDFDKNAAQIDVFFGGLSGETATVALPAKVKVIEYDEFGERKEVETDQLVLTKTFQISYRVPSEASARASKGLVRLSTEWVMR